MRARYEHLSVLFQLTRYFDEMYGESGYQMLLSTFRAPGNEPSQISAQNYLAQLLRGKSFRNIMSIFMSIFLLNQSIIG